MISAHSLCSAAKEVNKLTKEEQAVAMITKYMDLLRIEQADNRDIEIRNQLCETRAILEAMGIVVDNLKIEK